MSDTRNDPAEIEHELAATRARLGNHLDELTRRLSPGQLLDEGLSYLRNGDGAVFVRNLREQVRDHPLPVALTGIGIAWLALSGTIGGNGGGSASRALVPYDDSKAGRYAARDNAAERAQRAAASVTRLAGETEDAFSARVSAAQATVLGVTRQAQETAQAFADRVREALDQARATAAAWRDSAADAMDRAGDAAAAGRDRMADMGDRASRIGGYAADAGGRLAQALTENPLLLSAMSMSAGALLGALLPQTEFEARQFRPAGERAAGAAQEMARDVLERGARVVRAATDAGAQAARAAGAEATGTPQAPPPRSGNGADSRA